MAEPTKMTKADVLEILRMCGRHTEASLVETEGPSGRVICSVVATYAAGLHDPEYARGIDRQSAGKHDWRNELPYLKDWVEDHPEKF